MSYGLVVEEVLLATFAWRLGVERHNWPGQQ